MASPLAEDTRFKLFYFVLFLFLFIIIIIVIFINIQSITCFRGTGL